MRRAPNIWKIDIGAISVLNSGSESLLETYPDAPYATCYLDSDASKVIAVMFRSIDSAGKAVESEVWYSEKRKLFADPALEHQPEDWIITARYRFPLDDFSAILHQ